MKFRTPAVVLVTFQSDIFPCYSAHRVDAECSFETFLTICQYSPGDHTVRDPCLALIEWSCEQLCTRVCRGENKCNFLDVETKRIYSESNIILMQILYCFLFFFAVFISYIFITGCPDVIRDI